MIIKTRDEENKEFIIAVTKRIIITHDGKDMELIQEQSGKLYLIAFDEKLVLEPKSGDSFYINLK
jgi:hypothetical protein